MLKRIRIWLIRLLGGVALERYDRLLDYTARKAVEHNKEINRYHRAVREICRRSDHSYYDWCCDRCAVDDCKRDGWCGKFEPTDDF